jgi:hypothetical protein
MRVFRSLLARTITNLDAAHAIGRGTWPWCFTPQEEHSRLLGVINPYNAP